MNKIVVTLWSFLLSLTLTNHAFAIDGNMGNGSGTEASPYLIEDMDDFDEFAGDPNYWAEDAHTKLMCDIDLTERTYETAVIAPDTDNSTFGEQEKPYCGVFMGNNKTISNMAIDSNINASYYLGLFGAVEAGGIVKDLTISDFTIKSSAENVSHQGGICGMLNEGIIENCHSSGSIAGIIYHVAGGICGQNYSGTINNSSSNIVINADRSVQSFGGLCGKNSMGHITNCTSYGSISVGRFSNYIGGLVGGNVGTIRNCNSSTHIECKELSTAIGGLCGSNSSSEAIVIMSNAKGNIIAGHHSEKIGGFCGRNSGEISRCYSKGSITLEYSCSMIGGFCGFNNSWNNPGTILNCYATGTISAGDKTSSTGGFIGENEISPPYSDNNNIITNCYSTGSVTVGASGFQIFGFGQTEHMAIKCFWDTETSGLEDNDSNHANTPYGLPTEQMQTAATFVNAGWDFANIWTIGENQTYPVLRKTSGADIDGDGIVNLFDLQLLANNWLNGAE